MDRRTVAQFGSALHWGCRGRRFKSCQSDVQPTPPGVGFRASRPDRSEIRITQMSGLRTTPRNTCLQTERLMDIASGVWNAGSGFLDIHQRRGVRRVAWGHVQT